MGVSSEVRNYIGILEKKVVNWFWCVLGAAQWTFAANFGPFSVE